MKNPFYLLLLFLLVDFFKTGKKLFIFFVHDLFFLFFRFIILFFFFFSLVYFLFCFSFSVDFNLFVSHFLKYRIQQSQDAITLIGQHSNQYRNEIQCLKKRIQFLEEQQPSHAEIEKEQWKIKNKNKMWLLFLSKNWCEIEKNNENRNPKGLNKKTQKKDFCFLKRIKVIFQKRWTKMQKKMKRQKTKS